MAAIQYANAREFFEAVAEASRDIDRCRRQLDSMEHSALRISSPSFEARVRGGNDPDTVGTRVARMADAEARLRRRIEDDYALLDAASALLYGKDGHSGGLSELVTTWWCDAISLHYCDGMKWAVVAKLLNYSETYVKHQVQVALDVADANGMAATIAGIGMAEG